MTAQLLRRLCDGTYTLQSHLSSFCHVSKGTINFSPFSITRLPITFTTQGLATARECRAHSSSPRSLSTRVQGSLLCKGSPYYVTPLMLIYNYDLLTPNIHPLRYPLRSSILPLIPHPPIPRHSNISRFEILLRADISSYVRASLTYIHPASITDSRYPLCHQSRITLTLILIDVPRVPPMPIYATPLEGPGPDPPHLSTCARSTLHIPTHPIPDLRLSSPSLKASPPVHRRVPVPAHTYDFHAGIEQKKSHKSRLLGHDLPRAHLPCPGSLLHRIGSSDGAGRSAPIHVWC
ncbi:hypothetical protein DEU56DRAFT_559178 [Suillus clintonianus]|uniref:uncharacterized protein n=1 Tax=Suillus clintonianus TaxID=1904413 RepID=UPI001B868605|nr:uncharacterized protein DEU56DRAFT_559178 [Suillus clintonianus]KAG2125941.1 hypothetical protein DEU56DRAFT_559178 [Suillus clintonianus]